MAKRGQRLYLCGECSEKQFVHWIERNRAARLRCARCGSARMELANEDAKREAAKLQAVRVQGGTPSTSLPAEKPRKKVT